MNFHLPSESSLFIYPYKIILKTCGTTLNLLGLPQILEIAQAECSLREIHKCFYSRKSFMFPERQSGPHRDWKEEVRYLDDLFPGGAAYTVGKMNGDHWLLWLVDNTKRVGSAPVSPLSLTSAPVPSAEIPPENPLDYTLEMLMSNLSPNSQKNFFSHPVEATDVDAATPKTNGATPVTAQARALELSDMLGISSIFPLSLTLLDAYTFDPCGYSANAIISRGYPSQGEGYWTIHVTPEEGWSYASFECNVPAPTSQEELPHLPSSFPDLHQLIQRVVDIFQPGNLSITLFVSNDPPTTSSPIETAQSIFRKALQSKGYKRTDKITYEFSGYDLAFASFTL